ncbi:MAG: pseudaminic acid biosynthesis-associated methylase [Cyanobacteria bacterium SID2]|nr:pseudaminic acid biosynthesis-associated methylase [Cyanobacteria bacterium SID2]
MNFKTEQEEFWAGEFGVDYIERNKSSHILAANLALFTKALSKIQPARSCIEFGANIGMNLTALRLLYPQQEQYAIEINEKAADKLAGVIPHEHIYHSSILDFEPSRTWDLVLIKGVLIHINPEWLTQTYDVLYQSIGQYLLLCEYYNPSPVTISYRGHRDRLFKRDFCGEMLDRFPDLYLADYGFAYRRDPNFPQDDINWFLLQKKS